MKYKLCLALYLVPYLWGQYYNPYADNNNNNGNPQQEQQESPSEGNSGSGGRGTSNNNNNNINIYPSSSGLDEIRRDLNRLDNKLSSLQSPQNNETNDLNQLLDDLDKINDELTSLKNTRRRRSSNSNPNYLNDKYNDIARELDAIDNQLHNIKNSPIPQSKDELLDTLNEIEGNVNDLDNKVSRLRPRELPSRKKNLVLDELDKITREINFMRSDIRSVRGDMENLIAVLNNDIVDLKNRVESIRSILDIYNKRLFSTEEKIVANSKKIDLLLQKFDSFSAKLHSGNNLKGALDDIYRTVDELTARIQRLKSNEMPIKKKAIVLDELQKIYRELDLMKKQIYTNKGNNSRLARMLGGEIVDLKNRVENLRELLDLYDKRFLTNEQKLAMLLEKYNELNKRIEEGDIGSKSETDITQIQADILDAQNSPNSILVNWNIAKEAKPKKLVLIRNDEPIANLDKILTAKQRITLKGWETKYLFKNQDKGKHYFAVIPFSSLHNTTKSSSLQSKKNNHLVLIPEKNYTVDPIIIENDRINNKIDTIVQLSDDEKNDYINSLPPKEQQQLHATMLNKGVPLKTKEKLKYDINQIKARLVEYNKRKKQGDVYITWKLQNTQDKLVIARHKTPIINFRYFLNASYKKELAPGSTHYYDANVQKGKYYYAVVPIEEITAEKPIPSQNSLKKLGGTDNNKNINDNEKQGEEVEAVQDSQQEDNTDVLTESFVREIPKDQFVFNETYTTVPVTVNATRLGSKYDDMTSGSKDDYDAGDRNNDNQDVKSSFTKYLFRDFEASADIFQLSNGLKEKVVHLSWETDKKLMRYVDKLKKKVYINLYQFTTPPRNVFDLRNAYLLAKLAPNTKSFDDIINRPGQYFYALFLQVGQKLYPDQFVYGANFIGPINFKSVGKAIYSKGRDTRQKQNYSTPQITKKQKANTYKRKYIRRKIPSYDESANLIERNHGDNRYRSNFNGNHKNESIHGNNYHGNVDYERHSKKARGSSNTYQDNYRSNTNNSNTHHRENFIQPKPKLSKKENALLSGLNQILLQHFTKGSYTKTISKLVRYTKHPSNTIRIKALFYTGVSHYFLGNYKKAISLLNDRQVRKKYNQRAEFYYKRAISK